MGNYQEKELIVNQQSDVATKVEERYNQLSIWLVVIASLLSIVILFYLWKRSCQGLKGWLRKQATGVAVSSIQLQHQKAFSPPTTTVGINPSASSAADPVHGYA